MPSSEVKFCFDAFTGTAPLVLRERSRAETGSSVVRSVQKFA